MRNENDLKFHTKTQRYRIHYKLEDNYNKVGHTSWVFASSIETALAEFKKTGVSAIDIKIKLA